MSYAKATDEFYVPDAGGRAHARSASRAPTRSSRSRRRSPRRRARSFAPSTTPRTPPTSGWSSMGVARELARAVMPVGAYTEFYWTVNARALMNFVSLRAAETAQREIRRYAEACERLLAEHMPVTHEAFVAAGRVAPVAKRLATARRASSGRVGRCSRRRAQAVMTQGSLSSAIRGDSSGSSPFRPRRDVERAAGAPRTRRPSASQRSSSRRRGALGGRRPRGSAPSFRSSRLGRPS